MRVNFVFPSGPQWTGGVIMLYELANGLAARGHEVHFLHGPATPHRVGSLDELPAFAFHPDVVHHLADDLDDPSLPAGDVVLHPAAPARLGLPVAVIQGHRLIPYAMEEAAFRVRAPKLCVATWLLEVGRRFGVPDEQLLHLPLGLDHETFAVRTPIEDRPDDVAVLYNNHPEKGWAEALAALRTAADRRALRGTAFSMLDRPAGLPDGMRFVHRPDHAVLAADVYGRTRVFVQASLHEGFGLTPVEAMACGCALVTTDNGGSRDYAVDDETAVVVPPGDPDALARALVDLLDDEPRRQRLATAGAAHVRRFDWERSAAMLEAHLLDYLADPAALQRPPAEHVEVEPW